MQLIEVKQRSATLIADLVTIWKQSVQATHSFLSSKEIEKIKHYVPQAVTEVATLVIAENEAGKPVGFMGIAEGTLKMLFIAPEERGRGLDKQLLQLGIAQYGVERLTINEQNSQARGFYAHIGFKVYKRTATDEQGQPYPLLYMQLGN